jgi:phosphatidate cytidylyltransferase
MAGNGGAVWLLAFFALVSQLELIRLLEKLSGRVLALQVSVWTVTIVLGAWYLHHPYAGVWLTLVALLWMLVHGIIHLSPARLLTHLAPSLFSLLYIPFTLQFGVLLLRFSGNLWLLAWVVTVSKLGDIGGLLIGRRYGQHAFASKYSPQKTWEGFFGGVVLAAVGGLSICALAHLFGPFFIPFWLSIPLALLLATIGAVADLLESALKRLADIKDSGKIIPGIGGCLDFCDTLTLTLPTAYLTLQLLLT